jgi:beta-N-acetylhexosaminidase
MLITGILLAIAAVIACTATAAANRTHAPARRGGVFTGSSPAAGTRPADARSGGMVPVSPSIGLRTGAVSPSTAGIRTAMATVPKLSTLQLAGQRVIYSYTGLTPPAGLLSLIRHGEVAGVIFFKGNIASQSQLLAVARELQRANEASTNPVRVPLLLMTDQEGGQVRRLTWGRPTLSEKQIGQSAHPGAAATSAGNGAAVTLRAAGLNANLAPVLDVYRTEGNFIDQFGRSYSSNPAVVATLGANFIVAQQSGHVAATAKHFPGLGAATLSQNTDLRPVTLGLSAASIRNVDERPYTAAIARQVKLVMASWALYPALDARYPAGLSSKIVQGELRQRLGFAGVTITDALEAGALKNFGSTGNRATLAVKAGMDLLLCSVQHYSQGETAMKALNSYYLAASPAAQARFKAAAERVLALRATLPGA